MYYAKREVGGKLELENLCPSLLSPRNTSSSDQLVTMFLIKIIKMTKGVRKDFI